LTESQILKAFGQLSSSFSFRVKLVTRELVIEKIIENNQAKPTSDILTDYQKPEDCSTDVNAPMAISHALVNGSRTIHIGEKRKVAGFRCDAQLWDEFVKICISRYGSVCHVLEPIITALITKEVVVADGEKALNIEGDIVIERVVKKVRRVYVEEESSVTKITNCHICKKNNVNRVATTQARYLKSGQVYDLCPEHLDYMLKTTAWVRA
jgi:hypothetical protein